VNDSGGWRIALVIAAVLSFAGCQLSSTKQSVTAGALSLSPSTLSFTNVPAGTSQKQTVTVSNRGGSDVTVSQVTVSGTGFGLTGLTLPFPVVAGGSSTFGVTYAPTAAGSAAGTVTITSTAGTLPSVALTGSAVAAAALSANPSSVNFGSVLVGSSQAVSVTITNTGGSDLTVSQGTVTGTGVTMSGVSFPLTLAAGKGASFSVTFAPQSAAALTGNIALTNSASGSPLNIALSGTGVTPGSLGATPSSVSFGNVQAGASSTSTVTITNTGGQSVNVTAAAASGAGFSISGITPPLTLTSGQKFTFNAVFAPVAAGNATGSVSITSNASNPTLAIPLTGAGTAAGQLGATASLAFGSLTVGSSGNLSATLSATGANVTVTGLSSNNSEFTYSGLTLPVTITVGQNRSFTVTFAPQASGAASATLTYVSNASNSPSTALTGTGAAAVAHSVDLSWTGSTSTVSGYNVYRGGVSGGPYSKVNASLDPSTIYTDGSVASGQTYYYVVTAVDSSGTESAYSNQVQAVIPTP
jgi:ribosomal protein L11